MDARTQRGLHRGAISNQRANALREMGRMSVPATSWGTTPDGRTLQTQGGMRGRYEDLHGRHHLCVGQDLRGRQLQGVEHIQPGHHRGTGQGLQCLQDRRVAHSLEAGFHQGVGRGNKIITNEVTWWSFMQEFNKFPEQGAVKQVRR